jgi:opacity protein-like surface antigen
MSFIPQSTMPSGHPGMASRLAPLSKLFCLVGANVLLVNCCLAGDEPSDSGFYFGVFGGGGSLDGTSMQQVGTVLMRPILPFDIPVDAQGDTDSTSADMAGIKLGYQWSESGLTDSGWSLRPSMEIEGLHLEATPEGVLDIAPRILGTQYVSLPLNADVFLLNVVVSLRTPFSDTLRPYIGGGAGFALLSISGSDSTNPLEPGINHFNADPDASSSAFAMQAKIGIKWQVNSHWSVFGEFRHVFVASTSYTFGKTDYPPEVHSPTTTWDVELGRQNYNMFVAGIDFKF